MSIEATRLTEVGSDFTTEFLWKDVGRQFRVKDLEEYHSNLISIVSGILSDQATNRSIAASFTLRREKAAWKPLHSPVIGDALATSSLAVTGLIRTGASDFVFF
jgi:hypothetical protein